MMAENSTDHPLQNGVIGPIYPSLRFSAERLGLAATSG